MAKESRKVNKIGIYVPDHRLEEIEKWRDKLNFSELFWEAFDREVVNRSSISKVKGKAMKEVIERLKKEASGEFSYGKNTGIEWGTEWAKESAGRDHLQQIFNGPPPWGDGPVHKWLEWEYNYDAETWEELFNPNPPQCSQIRDAEAFEQGFAEGFAEGANAVWEEICEAFE